MSDESTDTPQDSEFEQWWQDQMSTIRNVSHYARETIVPGSTLGPSDDLTMEELELVRTDLSAFGSILASDQFDLLVWASLMAGDQAASQVWRECWDAYTSGLWPAEHIRDLAGVARQEAMRTTFLGGLRSTLANS